MQKIFVNGKDTTIDELISLFRDDDDASIDDLGAALDSDTLDKAIDSFTSSYSLSDLIEKYLQLADKPIEVEV